MEDESPTRHHPHHLSSLVVRPTDSGGGGSDYEPGEVRRDPPPYTRSDRYNDSSGHVMRADSVSPLHYRKVEDRYRSGFDNSSGPQVINAGSVSPLRYRNNDDRYRPDFDDSISPRVMRTSSVSPLRYSKVEDRYRSDFDDSGGQHVMHAGPVSPLRQRKVDDRYRPDFDNSSGPQRDRGLGGGKAHGRFRDFSPPPYGRGRGVGRPSGRSFDMFDRGSFRNDGMIRNHPNVAPRDGDWMCPDPSCGNLNFARRHYCNKCKKPRFEPDVSPRRDYPGPPRFSGPAFDRPPVRGGLNGYRSPPRGDWGRGAPRGIGAGPPHIRHGGRFPDQMRRERLDYPEEDFGDRGRFDRSAPLDWGLRDRGRDNVFNGRRGYDARNGRQPLSPPPQRRPLSPPPQRRPPLSPPPQRRPPLSPPPQRRPLSPLPQRRPLSPPSQRRPLSPPLQRRGLSPPLQRRALSPLPPPPPPPPRARWAREVRERSRSPMMGGPPKDRQRESFLDRGRGPRWGTTRDRFDDHPY